MAMAKLHTMLINQSDVTGVREDHYYPPRASLASEDGDGIRLPRVNLRILTNRLAFPRLDTLGVMLAAVNNADSLECLVEKALFPSVSSASLSIVQASEEEFNLLPTRPLSLRMPTTLRWREIHLFMDHHGHWLRLLSWIPLNNVVHTLCLRRRPSFTRLGEKTEWEQLTTTLLTRISDILGQGLRHLYLCLSIDQVEEWPLLVELASTERFFPNLIHLYLDALPLSERRRQLNFREALLRKENPHFTIHFCRQSHHH